MHTVAISGLTDKRLRVRVSVNQPLRRAGDVIPQVLGLASPPHPDSSSAGGGDDDSARFAFPTCCPACGTPVVKEEVSVARWLGVGDVESWFLVIQQIL